MRRDVTRVQELDGARHWIDNAENWARWATVEGLDSYWTLHGPVFHSLVGSPVPGADLALDLACGEGRVGRRLAEDGWSVIATDVALASCRHAADTGLTAVAASADNLPFAGGSFDLVAAFMALHDFDTPVLAGALREVTRLLRPGGRFVAAINHPGRSFLDADREGDAITFTVRHGYFSGETYRDLVSRQGESMEFLGIQRPLEDYLNGAVVAGLRFQAIREVSVPRDGSDRGAGSPDWAKVPMFADLVFVKDPA